MLTNVNEGDWVSLFDGDTHEFIKVARVEHKFTLSGEEAKTFKKNFIEVLAIRIHDAQQKVFNASGHVQSEYLVIDAHTGKELNSRFVNLKVEPIPHNRNFIFDDTGKTWEEMIEQQTMIYELSDMDWRSMDYKSLKKISFIIMEDKMKGTDAS